MVSNRERSLKLSQRGVVMHELIIAIGILSAVILPLAYGHLFEANAIRASYWRAVAMEIVDGELEGLAAGEWRSFGQGEHDYKPHAAAAGNLPPGKFTFTVVDRRLRLEWKPSKRQNGGDVVREATGI